MDWHLQLSLTFLVHPGHPKPPNIFERHIFLNKIVLTSFTSYFKTFLFWPAAIQTYGFPQEQVKT